ncbi:DUF6436 domain-containing protein [Corallincola spongiicola]|uniref:DUF6436 domain-containing protein n=1 Tax=Corallincola spongiicola TaxID=2520508 RepID=A0ABY1WQF3_9GAMM|nr:DUF6436 domain-containing protein [Corallincola spongiicola]TAA46946.1 hypothetical protein EXY25_06740 [Corallincola spongiicola]
MKQIVSRKYLASFALFVVWIGFTAWAFWYTQFAPLILFDQHDRVRPLTESPATFTATLRQHLPIASEQNGAVMVHFTQQGCDCLPRASRHIEQLQKQATELKVRNITLSLEQHPVLARWIPATPATLLLDSTGQLRYFGPYSAGLLCSSRNSLVESILKQIATPHPALMPMEVLGCYCPTDTLSQHNV